MVVDVKEETKMEQELNENQKREFLKICGEVIDEKIAEYEAVLIDKQSKELKNSGKEFNRAKRAYEKEFELALDKVEKDFHKKFVEQFQKFSAEKISESDLSCLCSSADDEMENWLTDISLDEDSVDNVELSSANQKLLDNYEDKLTKKLSEIREDLIFGDAPKLKKLLSELRAI